MADWDSFFEERLGTSVILTKIPRNSRFRGILLFGPAYRGILQGLFGRFALEMLIDADEIGNVIVAAFTRDLGDAFS